MQVKNTFGSGICAIGAVALLVVGPTVARAALMSSSATTPTVNSDDIAQLAGTTDGGGDDGHIWGDRPVMGQSFLTGSNALGYTLSAVTLRSLIAQPNPAATWNLRIGTVSGTTFAPTATETAAGVAIAANDWVTYTFAAPVALLPNTTYGFDVGALGNGFVTANASDNTPYADGTAYASNDNAVGNNVLTLNNRDRVFHVDVAAVPEPASLGLLALGSLGLLSRRRRA